MNRTAVVITLCLVVFWAGSASAFQPMPRSTPAEHQVDEDELAAAFDAAEDLTHVLGMVVVRDGAVIGEEHYWGEADTLWDVRSVTKSVISILVGIAIEQGFIEDGLYARMVDYLPEDLIPDDPVKHEILIWHLLTMTAGFEWDDTTDVIPWLNDPDPVGAILSTPMAAPPGTQYTYNTAASHLLSVVLTEATGMGTLEFADRYLFGPLGISDRFWIETGGYPNGGLGLKVSTEDAAKFGLLFIDGGVWQGERIVSKYWVNLSTVPIVQGLGSFGPLHSLHYGLLWRVDLGTEYHAYLAWGYGGQFVFCVPGLKLVVAVQSMWNAPLNVAAIRESAILDIIVNQIIPATTDRRVIQATGQVVPELAAVDDMMEDILRSADIRDATAAVAKDGRLVYARGFSWGEPDVEPVQPTALFRVGSIAKAITSVAVHQGIERGDFNHDTPVNPILDLEALPGSQSDPLLEEVTVDHMLTHTGGLYSEDNIYQVTEKVSRTIGKGPPVTTEEMLSYIVSEPFIFDPGMAWDYNNYGYMMLDELLEHTTGSDFSQYVIDNLFRPVGVGRARVAHQLESELVPTEVDYDGFEGDPYLAAVENGVAAGGWVMAAPDMARLFSALFDFEDASGLLDPITREQMFDLPFPVCEEVGYGRGWLDESFFFIEDHTIGWLTDLDDGLEVRSHGGGGAGVHTLALWRSDGITFVIFTNRDPLVADFDFPEITAWPDHDLWDTVGVSLEPVGAAPTEVWIPVVASTDGAGGSVWRTDLGLLNRSPLANSIRLRIYQAEGTVDHEIALAPGEYTTVGDVMAELGVTGASPLRVFSSEPLTVTSRTYNLAASGTFGQFLDSATPTSGLETGDEVVLMQLAENEAKRTNIGVHNGWKRAARVEIALFDGDSLPLGHAIREIPPEQTLQLNRPFDAIAGRSDIASGYAVVTVLFGQHLQVYGSVIDNLTNDPTTIPMKEGTGAVDQWVAAAAHASGAHGSEWRTDLCVLNRSGATATVEVRYRDDGGAAETTMIVLEHGFQRVLDDVVQDMGMEGGGSLEVFADRPVMVSSRTYNLGEDGSYGQYLDGTPIGDTAGDGEVVWLPQLQQNQAFRTNIGLQNTGDEEAIVVIRLYDALGEQLAAPHRTLPARSRLQLQEPFRRIANRTDIDAGYASVTVESGDGVIAYASVIDNLTNDPTTVPMKF